MRVLFGKGYTRSSKALGGTARGSEGTEMWAQGLAEPPISCLPLGKLPNFSKSQSPHL